MDGNQVFLDAYRKQFLYYKTLGEKAIDQLTPELLFVKPNENSNSIATIVKHLSGNMISRWTDFRTTDGEKEWRDRDGEFENDIPDLERLLLIWEEGWRCLLGALDSTDPDQLTEIIYIRNEGHTIMEALSRQLAHYPYHIGQMIYAAKLLKESEWKSLSIAKNNSRAYNDNKFAKEKAIKNFTEEELEKLQ
ncbi:DUF1572 family protein [Paenibacillus lutrae]|uniref:DUF1572 domain-containing protein n=1 Tax=Paenibacillus lutrae TaxID=2078573 RepID=A0A7X3FKA1_9BACL|nr:DUF1572 family protein [Paenibacillus lutrae]MVP01167.1 DUF1572 domain-containing protein [Paenibacillus lutrae]